MDIHFFPSDCIRLFKMAEFARAIDNTLRLVDATGSNAEEVDAYLGSIHALSASPPLVPPSQGHGDCNGKFGNGIPGWKLEAAHVPDEFEFVVADSNIPIKHADNGKLPPAGIARGQCNSPLP
jgi:hypothetical protein